MASVSNISKQQLQKHTWTKSIDTSIFVISLTNVNTRTYMEAVTLSNALQPRE